MKIIPNDRVSGIAQENTGRRKGFLSLRLRLLIPAIFLLLLLLLMNVFLFKRVNRGIRRLNSAYDTSIQLTELQNGLTELQRAFDSYINTQSDAALQAYQNAFELFQNRLGNVPSEISDQPARQLERTIRELSDSYLLLTGQAVRKKQRGGIADCREEFIKARTVYGYILSNCRSLELLRFQLNSDNYDILYHSLENLEQIILLILCTVSIYMLIILWTVISTVIRPLRELSDRALEVEGGNLDIAFPEVRHEDEVGTLTRTFSSMLQSIRADITKIKAAARREMEMREKELKMDALLKDAQLKYYQAQLDPHFLFNTLNAGQQLSMMEDAERTYAFLNHTAAFLRGQLRGNGRESTIQDELILVDNYIYIMNVRFSGEYTLKKEIDDRLLEAAFPGMVLQPIVENSLKYAYDPDFSGDKLITIRVSRENERYALIEIQDNGCGIPEKKLEEIRSGEINFSRNPKESGVGLKNVRERLRLYYQKEDVFKIENVNGTRVRISVPVKKCSIG